MVLFAFLIGLSLEPAPPKRLAEARRLLEEGAGLADNPVEARKRFESAARHLTLLRLGGAENAEQSRCEGNAWLLAGDVPRAILAYQRGLRHRPTDARLQAGLALARESVARKAEGGLGRPPVDDRPPWLPRVGFSTGSLLLVLVLYVFSCLALVRYAMVRRPGLLAGGAIGLSLSIVLTALLGLATLHEERRHAHPLVVIAVDDLPLRLGNGISYGSRYSQKLPRGAEARLLHRRGDWLQVELSGGETGWIPAQAMANDPIPMTNDQ